MSVASGGVERSRPAAPGIPRTLLVVFLLGALAVAVSGPVAAADTTPPEWGNATRGNATTIDVTVYDDGALEVGSQRATNVSSGDGGFALPGVPSLPAVPNPLAFWPGGVVGTRLGALVGLFVVVYGILKALAIHLGY